MARRKSIAIEKVAARLAGGDPLAWHQREDGSLVVIGPAGRKFVYTAAAVRKAAAQLRKEAAI